MSPMCEDNLMPGPYPKVRGSYAVSSLLFDCDNYIRIKCSYRPLNLQIANAMCISDLYP